MSALTRFFFRNEVSCRSTAEVIGWWESRRLPYNVAVGSAGLLTLAGVQFILWVPPLSAAIPFVPSIVLPLAYGVMANVCYTGGWMAELGIRRILGREMEPVGPALFRYGFVFSIGLTLFPIAIASMLKLSLILRFLF
jgi:hypothetical protein